jgi:hypothetical protein
MKEQLTRMMHWDVARQAQRINAILRGHFAYYGMAGNSRRMQTFYWEVKRQWRRCLSQRSQKGAVNWEQMRDLLNKHRLVMPMIRIRYQDLAGYVRL